MIAAGGTAHELNRRDQSRGLRFGQKACVMSGLDIFAWIVLIILVASAIAGVLHRRMAAGTHRENPRPSAGASRDGGWLDHPDLRFCAVAGRADLGLRRCAGVA